MMGIFRASNFQDRSNEPIGGVTANFLEAMISLILQVLHS